jgi:CubicO group peptidase (beta-lactamase class C family)
MGSKKAGTAGDWGKRGALMGGRRQFLGAASMGFLGGWASIGRGQEPAGAEGPAKAARRKALKPVLPMEPPPPRGADQGVNKRLAGLVERHKVPGMIAAVVRGGTIEAIGAAGVRKARSEEPIRIGDQVHIGSCTKAMTATMVGTIVDEGALKWSSTIAGVFPDLAGAVHPDYREVTLLQLLNHRAGLPPNVEWWRLGRRQSTTQQRRNLLERELKEAPSSKPGTAFLYSNVGYALAGLMAEQVTRRAWEDLMRQRLFEPMGMDTAGFGCPGRPGRMDQPWGHSEHDGNVEPSQSDNAPSLGPAGTVHVSIPDWAKFALLHLRGDRGEATLLQPATFRVLHTPPEGSTYAGGWGVYDQGGGRVLSHDGSNTMWYASILIAPARSLAILVATNQGGDIASRACSEAVRELIPLGAGRQRG